MVWKIILGIILFIYILLRCSVTARISASKGKLEISVKYLFFQLYPRREKPKNKKAKISKNNKSHKHTDDKKREKLEAELQKEKEAIEKALAKANINAEDDSFEKIAEKIKVNYQKEDTPPEKEKTPDNKLKEKQDNKPEDKPKKAGIKELYNKFKPYVPIAFRAIKRMKNAIRIRDLYFRLAIADEDAYECAMKYGKANAAIYMILAVLKSNMSLTIKNIIIESKFNSNKSEYEIDFKVKIRPSTVLAIGLRASFSVLWLILKEKLKSKKNKETEMLKA